MIGCEWMNEKLDYPAFQSKLEGMKKDLEADLARERQGVEEDGVLNPDRADLAQDYALHERQQTIFQRLQDQFDQVQAALQRIEVGSFGKCENCGKSISTDRLEALPYASMCMDCQQRDA